MINQRWRTVAVACAMFAAGFAARGLTNNDVAHAQAANRVFEMRTYTANPGKFEALKTRFRDHTIKLFEKHGITNIGYWVPIDPPKSENTLIYIIAYPSVEAAKKNWAAFQNDPDWKKAASDSQKDGLILAGRPESVFMTPADFSQIK
jgi:hypothetical protein